MNGMDIQIMDTSDCKELRALLKGVVKVTVRLTSGLITVRPRGGYNSRFSPEEVTSILDRAAVIGMANYGSSRPIGAEEYGAFSVVLCKMEAQ